MNYFLWFLTWLFTLLMLNVFSKYLPWCGYLIFVTTIHALVFSTSILLPVDLLGPPLPGCEILGQRGSVLQQQPKQLHSLQAAAQSSCTALTAGIACRAGCARRLWNSPSRSQHMCFAPVLPPVAEWPSGGVCLKYCMLGLEGYLTTARQQPDDLWDVVVIAA